MKILRCFILGRFLKSVFFWFKRQLCKLNPLPSSLKSLIFTTTPSGSSRFFWPKRKIESGIMEVTVNIHIEKLPEGLYLATSDDVQGLVAQGRTITETLEIARDVVKKLLEGQAGLTPKRIEDNIH